MNAAHLHLMVNHFPLVGLVFSLVFLAIGLLRTHGNSVRAGLLILVISGLFTVFTFLTGEPAEERLGKLATFSKQLAETHEESAELTLWIVGVTTVAGGIGLWLSVRRTMPSRRALGVIVALNLASLLSIGQTSLLGGKISHPEVRQENAPELTPLDSR
jgi:uncharacterized membrane protein